MKFKKDKFRSQKFTHLKSRQQMTLISDGVHDKEFATQYIVVDKAGSVTVKLLRRGGFAAKLSPIQ